MGKQTKITITDCINRWYYVFVPNLEYCRFVFHGCGKGNEEELEGLQRRAARIVLKTVHCPLKIWLPVLVATLLRREERNISSSSLRIVLMDKLQVISQIIFESELMIFMTITLGLRITYLLIKSISSWPREPFYIRGLPFLMIVCTFVHKEATLFIDCM